MNKSASFVTQFLQIKSLATLLLVSITSSFGKAEASHPPATRTTFNQLKKDSTSFKHASSAKAKIGAPLPSFSVPALNGPNLSNGLSNRSFKGDMGLFVLADTKCPCVQAIELRLKDLSKRYAKNGLRIVYVFSMPNERAIDIARFMRAYQIPFPALIDREQKMLKMLDGRCSSEVYLTDKRGVLRYHGRVDDSTFDPKAVKSRDLENAITAILRGQKVTKPEVAALGCAIPRL